MPRPKCVLLLDHLLPHADNLRGLLETLWSSMCREERKLPRKMESVLIFVLQPAKYFLVNTFTLFHIYLLMFCGSIVDNIWMIFSDQALNQQNIFEMIFAFLLLFQLVQYDTTGKYFLVKTRDDNSLDDEDHQRTIKVCKDKMVVNKHQLPLIERL